MSRSNPTVVAPPAAGIWRVARGEAPLTAARPEPGTLLSSRSGNRFDDPTGDEYGVLYFGTSLTACFGEVLARKRPSIPLAELVAEEWRQLGFMEIGAVPADWRNRRSAIRITIPGASAFLDVESMETHLFLRSELALGLAALGHDDLDVATVRGRDRRVTRLISQWAYRYADENGVPVYDGIRYLSRVNTEWECWAVFEDVDWEVVETRPITLDMAELTDVAEKYSLRLH